MHRISVYKLNFLKFKGNLILVCSMLQCYKWCEYDYRLNDFFLFVDLRLRRLGRNRFLWRIKALQWFLYV